MNVNRFVASGSVQIRVEENAPIRGYYSLENILEKVQDDCMKFRTNRDYL